MTTSITGSLQENLLTLLCFDSESAPLIINTVDTELFENKFYKIIAEKAKNFYSSFKKAPGDHLPDLLEKELATEDEDSAIFEDVIFKLHEFKEGINKEYVIKQLTSFIREQRLKAALTESVKQVQVGNIEKAEHLLSSYNKEQITTFEPGMLLAEENFAKIFSEDAVEVFKTGIEPLDKLNIGPARGELLVLLAGANRGKTNWLIHLGKTCTRQRLKVLHISLEMSEIKILRRYLQSFFAVTKRKQPVKARYFQTNDMGRFSGFETKELDRPAFSNKDDLEKIRIKMKKYGLRTKLWVKQFPTGALTVDGLEFYLDSLEQFENFIPDVLLIDYPDLMKIDYNQLREATGAIYKELRRIAVERNIAVVAPSQSNRSGEDAKVITLKHFAEDYSKAMTADNVLAYAQTTDEYNLGLARIFVAKARDEQKFTQILITQAYDMGQFCLSAVKMEDHYWDEVNNLSGTRERETDETPTETRSSMRPKRPKPTFR